MRRTEALQGVGMAVFLNILNRWESAELNQEEAAGIQGNTVTHAYFTINVGRSY
jgi:hypothetical protein